MESHTIFPWFRATLISWLYVLTKIHKKKHQKEYCQFPAKIGPEAFKRRLLTHLNGITTGWKRVGKVSRDNTKARESILEEDLAKKRDPELTSILLPEQGVQGKIASKPFKKILRAKGMDAGL